MPLVRVLQVVGGIATVGGIAHLAGVAYTVTTGPIPPPGRATYLAGIALAHWAIATLDFWAASMLRQDRRRAAFVRLLAALSVLSTWAAIQVPVFLERPSVISSGPLAYLAAHVALAAAVGRRNETSGAGNFSGTAG